MTCLLLVMERKKRLSQFASNIAKKSPLLVKPHNILVCFIGLLDPPNIEIAVEISLQPSLRARTMLLHISVATVRFPVTAVWLHCSRVSLTELLNPQNIEITVEIPFAILSISFGGRHFRFPMPVQVAQHSR